MSKAKKRIGLWLTVLGVLAIVAGISLGGYNLWDNYRAGEEADYIVQTIIKMRDQRPPQQDDIPRYMLDPFMDMPTIEIKGYSYIGTLEIPALDLKLPVMETWDYKRLTISPCRYEGSAYLNNMILCAHNYATHFGRIANLKTKDQVIFTDADGNVFYYEVVSLEKYPGNAVEEMESGDWDLTLFTCTLSGALRTTVRCNQLL